ncbi:MAG: cyclodeaminase/cyclohydrolase family protein [Thermoplasmata archaeon]|uniref:Cyclodeaminase/cyclohydrolase family protein n=1 Tax=Candidatus Sysuiplasma superficiale TaxID=2823368 RepID=A0A8J7YS66_9ARCH|nr:cyclodeaminase/cyclohydrolase family protein [Candidatus Sysuiplasma superficiale]MBX8644251.1 cyclodeaminase/cyclohydrolase family protein [Candidatus Sysuiplasma superficiale]MCL4347349.1 cyclodeaminase/cyclohydrolase family protein [Candidatus Thermoplasmatota archaeon]
MTYAEKSVGEFIRELSSASPTPGGGSASAVVGSAAAALIIMDCNLTIGKESYKHVKKNILEIRGRCMKVRNLLLRLADRDARSFEAVMRALSMPRESELQKLKRYEKIQSALKKACEVPLEVMYLCSELQGMANYMADNGNRNSRSDAMVGCILAEAALKGAYENLEVNLESIKDSKFVDEVNRKVAELMRSLPQFVR